MSDAEGVGETVDVGRAHELLGRSEARAIDLRGEDEVAEGHAPGAVMVVDGDLKDAAETVLRGDDLPVLVFCESGERSEDAAAELREAGIEAAAIEGGWSKWIGAGMPTQPGSDEEYDGPELKQPGNA